MSAETLFKFTNHPDQQTMNTPTSPLAPATIQASASAPKSFTVGCSAATGNNLLLTDDQTGGPITITSATTASTEHHLQEPVGGGIPLISFWGQ